MYQTSLLLKLKPDPKPSVGPQIKPVGNSSRNASNGGAKVIVKLARQIQGAKYLKINCDITHVETALGVKCDLIDESQSFTNLESGVVLDRVKESTTMLLTKSGGYRDTIPIASSKSVINEFEIEVFPLRGVAMSPADVAGTFLQVVIYHTGH